MRFLALSCLVAVSLGVGTVLSSGAAGSAYPASSPRQAVSIFVSSVTARRPFRTGCHPYMGSSTLTAQLATCPITSRLRQGLLRSARAVNALCRCENPSRAVTVFPSMTSSKGTYVEGYFDYGSNSFVITYSVVRGQGGWLVDDTYCLRRPETSVYTRRGGLPCP